MLQGLLWQAVFTSRLSQTLYHHEDHNHNTSPSSTGPHASGDAQHALHEDQAHTRLEPTTVPRKSHSVQCVQFMSSPVSDLLAVESKSSAYGITHQEGFLDEVVILRA
jgi:hypothetical protein